MRRAAPWSITNLAGQLQALGSPSIPALAQRGAAAPGLQIKGTEMQLLFPNLVVGPPALPFVRQRF